MRRPKPPRPPKAKGKAKGLHQLDAQSYDLCLSSVLDIITNHTKRKLLTELESEEAQCMADFLSEVLAHQNSLSLHDRKHILHALVNLAKSSQVFPRSLELEDVKCTLLNHVVGGGYGLIYKGEYENRSVCIKAVHILGERIDKSKMRAQSSEVILWANMSHPNVVPFLGIYLSEEAVPRVCIVSPWMEKGDLAGYLKAFPDAHPVPLVQDIISGLKYLHDFEIVHADLKANNVLISEANRAMLADFGVSRVLVTTMTTMASDLPGTGFWMAPELLLDDTPRHKPESDIWAFACTCYEIITGMQPFHQFTRRFQLIAAFLKGNIAPRKPAAADGWNETKEKLWLMAERCWKRDPESRPTAEELLKLVADLNTSDHRLPESDHHRTKTRNKADYHRVFTILDQIKGPKIATADADKHNDFQVVGGTRETGIEKLRREELDKRVEEIILKGKELDLSTERLATPPRTANPSSRKASPAASTTTIVPAVWTVSDLAKLPAAEVVGILNDPKTGFPAGIVKADPAIEQKTNKFVDSLMDKPVQQQKKLLHDKLLKVVKSFGIKDAPKITSSLIDQEDLRALAHVMNSYIDVLKEKVMLLKGGAPLGDTPHLAPSENVLPASAEQSPVNHQPGDSYPPGKSQPQDNLPQSCGSRPQPDPGSQDKKPGPPGDSRTQGKKPRPQGKKPKTQGKKPRTQDKKPRPQDNTQPQGKPRPQPKNSGPQRNPQAQVNDPRSPDKPHPPKPLNTDIALDTLLGLGAAQNFLICDLSAPEFALLKEIGPGKTVPLTEEELQRPATQPVLNRLRIECDLVPQWPLTLTGQPSSVGTSTPPITLNDVLSKIYAHFLTGVRQTDWDTLSPEEMTNISMANTTRCKVWIKAGSGGKNPVVKRIDYCLGNVWFKGLTRSGNKTDVFKLHLEKRRRDQT